MDRYDEALAKARAGKSLEEIFPEMKEGEDERDERIRKAIVHLLTVASESYLIDATGFKKEQFLSYLEKQKEQKPELYYDKELDIAAREFYLSGGADSPVDSTGLVPIVRMAEFGATWMKERTQKEQKAILSDRDSTDFEIEVHEIIAQARNDSRLNDADVLKQFEEEAAFALMLKANKLIEQKPAECADDVVEEAEEYTSKIACGEYGVEVTEAYIAGVLSERNRGTGWSEEDERMRNQLIYDIEYHKKEGLVSAKQNKATEALYNGIEKCYDEKIAWLKSLRPQQYCENCKLKRSVENWKPSEEQMEALNALNCHGDLSYVGQQNQLISLYNDLKKLM